jgi:hypothetical protein
MSNLSVNTIASFDDLKTVSSLFSQSGTFGKETPQILAVKIMAGLAFGLDPFTAAAALHVIQGRVVMSAGLQARLIKSHPKYDYIVRTLTNEECVIEFFQNDQQSVGISTFTIEDAKKASLNGKDNWKNYPRNMLFSRAIANGIRWFCPDALGQSVYTPDELNLPTLVTSDGDIAYNGKDAKSTAVLGEGLPFDSEESAIVWARDYLGAGTIDEMQEKYSNTVADANGRKAINFYLGICQEKRDNS